MKRTFRHINDGITEYELGHQYYTECRYEKAVEMFMIAASVGHAMSHKVMGMLTYNGLGIPQNIERANKWWLSSARLDCSNLNP